MDREFHRYLLDEIFDVSADIYRTYKKMKRAIESRKEFGNIRIRGAELQMRGLNETSCSIIPSLFMDVITRQFFPHDNRGLINNDFRKKTASIVNPTARDRKIRNSVRGDHRRRDSSVFVSTTMPMTQQ